MATPNQPTPTHPAPAPPPGALGGPASDHILSLAEELVSYIQGEPQRTEDMAQATGRVIHANARKQNLAVEVANKIRAMAAAMAENPQHVPLAKDTPPHKAA
jgi:hypothetical protein